MKTRYFNGTILTMTSPEPVSALLVEDGRIAAVGFQAEGAAADRAVDLHGCTLMPAFLDPHSHFCAAANHLLQVPLGDAAGEEDMARAVADYISRERPKPGQWVMAEGYDQNRLPGGRHPTLAMLDRASPNHPAVLQHKSGHMGVFNSLALRELGITVDTPDPEGGHIGREQGALTGYLEENAYMQAMQRLPMPELSQLLDACRRAQDLYASHGVVTVQEGIMYASLIPLYRALLDENRLKLDVVGYPDPGDLDGVQAAFPNSVGRYDRRFRLGGVKLFLDGSPQGKTAWLRKPYEDSGDYAGYPTMTDGGVEAALRMAAERKTQILVHCNGDRAVQQYLEAGEAVERDLPGLRDLRPVIIHAQTIGLDQLRQAKALGFTPSFFVAHVYHWGDVHLKNLGWERASAISPAGTALELGMPFTFHQDTPVLPPDMLETVWCAVNRVTRAGVTLGEGQRIPVYQALRAVTANAAWQYFEEDSKGTLEPGKRADLVLLDRNPLEVPPERLREIRVLATVKDGETVWESAR